MTDWTDDLREPGVIWHDWEMDWSDNLGVESWPETLIYPLLFDGGPDAEAG